MALIKGKYEDLVSKMKPGDIIAFSGKGHFSEIIKWVTCSEVFHVGIVCELKVLFPSGAQPKYVVDVMESTTISVDKCSTFTHGS